ncbi:DinB family protein [Pseudoneobacillus rhizosphaerae]|jgi:uncharacterized damage-inducible protein DinB|uniref:DinB-like domain-containing protein n=1 Tax=Pseudoneobacillus rhizosphaerae TaxID=2880968 RepID=A0A9C7L967_9BACI|nr:DinB family protein [Pseudoneobacillus rhizosphaerae]CAG9606977.1 hypothetical protein NEOCIP111885_00665 [Pseudoneobacillus rhizosphaerae]
MKHNKEVREEVLKSVIGLTDSQLNEKPTGKWSIMQVLEHLYLLERLIVHQMSKLMNSDEEAVIEDKPINQIIDRTSKFDAPSYVTPSDEFMTLTTIQEKLHKSRSALEAFIVDADEEKMLKRTIPHPVFGPFHLKQWVEIIGWHEKRHLEQIEEIKAELGL